jgi:hypothetical protein
LNAYISNNIKNKTQISVIKENDNNETSIFIVFVVKSTNELREYCAYSSIVKEYKRSLKKITKDTINPAITLLAIGPLQKFFILFIVLFIPLFYAKVHNYLLKRKNYGELLFTLQRTMQTQPFGV